MVSPNFKIDQPRDDEIKTKEDRYLRKERKPSRDFREVAEQVDERRYREKDDKKTDKKSNSKKSANEQKEEEQALSLFDLVRNTKNSKEDKERNSKKDDAEEIAIGQELAKKTRDKHRFNEILNSKKSNHPEFVPEHQDLSAVNPLVTAQQTNQTTTSPIHLSTELKTQASTPVQNLQDIIDSIAKAAYQVETEGKTETVVTLKGPLFDQSRLILTEFNSAKGEFNITIDNLTQQAKNFLDASQNTLIENLSKKGYMVHIMTTTTNVETPQIDLSAHPHEDTQREGNQEEQNPNQRDQEDQQ
ncbi:MAG: hypothetical protein ACSNEK_02420 [Parachlamydiaceae bacterium]